ncbi:MAG: VWA domain-containing protein [candidate division Zixibacteria bacterium]|nr:VWA domain-containing protein [candidate division Zixibacteria bacterium]NIR65110.1 VWA domain-containing protein [candidate division Zixibacteria bacterium]NIS17844.1 VWA domain-containing protein [candidate division Zixibacteria bacterium]NIS46854.1 VWA domain-containing protein [candidate division Zixibacteria bacterium]NIT54566.1 VWA domain-containing protein [candidate division Zixibacteria bacterium]
MGFLNTTILLLSALAIIPILIHLFNRQRVKRIQFSSIRYLKSLQKTRMRRLKLKQILLLILRTLIILLLVIAFARPTTEGSYSSALGSAAQASVVIMIDNSLSMSTETPEGSLFELAKTQALSILGDFQAKDEIAVVAFSKDPVIETNGFTTNHTFVRKTISDLEPSHTSTNPVLAFEAALDLMQKSDNLVKEIYVFSDLAGPSWEALSLNTISQFDNLKIYVAGVTKEDYENVKVANIDFGNSLIYPGRPVNISADIINESQRRVDNLLISLFIDKKRISQTDISVSPGSSEKVSFTYTFENPGEHEGFIEITDDDLIEDNRVYFTINIPNEIRTLSLYENEGDDFFVRMAFQPLPESPSQINLASEPISSLPTLNLENFDCIIMSNSKFLSQANMSKLMNYVKSGGSMLAFISDDNNKEALNERIIQPAFGSSIAGKLEVTEGQGFYRLSSLDFTHPIFSRFADIEDDYLPEIDFFKILQVRPPSEGKILASFSTGAPAVMDAQWGSGKILTVMSSPSAEDSDLISHPFFVTFMNRAVEYLAYDINRLRENFITGEPINKILLNINPKKTVEVVTPSDNRIYPAYNFSGSELNLTIPPVQRNGIATILVDDNPAEKFAVNFPLDESNGVFLEVDDLRGAAPDFQIIKLPPDADHAQIIRESRLGKEFSKIFFILALVLLAVEMILARSSREPAPETS